MSSLSELQPSGAGGGSVELVASGALSSGDVVVVNSDGTVSVVEVSEGFGVASTISMGSNIGSLSIAFDPTDSTKFVLSYADASNSYYGTAVIGTISGSTITFGTASVFRSSYVAGSPVAFTSDGSAIVINFRDYGNSNYGYVIAATVSGTSLSFGSASNYQSGTTYSPDLVADPDDATKFIFTYRTTSNYGAVRIGTVSGNSVSYGSEYIFNSATTYEPVLAVKPDTSDIAMVFYKDAGNNSYPTIRAMSWSGTSITMGTEQVVDTVGASEVSIAYDPNDIGTFALAYADTSATNSVVVIGNHTTTSSYTLGAAVTFYAYQGGYIDIDFDKGTSGTFYVGYKNALDYNTYATVGTVSGTSCSFSSATQLSDTSNTYYMTVEANDSGNILMIYLDSTASDGEIALCSNTASNLTSTNYIGIASKDYADAATATIQIKGSVNESQTGLTAGSKYYVQTDGTLSTTPDSPSVYAGKAVSSTKLIVKG